MRVVILGCGPAGLFAAHAARSLGHTVMIMSKLRKSHMYGAQYLHEPIPRLGQTPHRTVHYKLAGTAEEYAEKVYGEVPADFVSPERYVGEHPAWDIRAAYDEAWDRYGILVRNVVASPVLMMDLLDDKGIDRVISTVPAHVLCYQPDKHHFTARDVWAIGDAPDRFIHAPRLVDPFTVVCNGSKDTGWYRASNIFGFNTVEWPEDRKPPIEHVARIAKPVKTNCDCYKESGKVWRAGRYGTWQKGYLAHQAYHDIIRAFKEL